MRIILLLFVALVAMSMLSTRQASAQEATAAPVDTAPIETIADLKFPIDDLGNCTTFNNCNTFCGDPVNFSTCAEFAKTHGFYKDDKVLVADNAFWQKAKDALGCDTKESCLIYCANTDNFDKCDTFTKAEGLVGGYVEELDTPAFLIKAKEALGCDSTQSCASFCDNTANAEKCAAFANQVGLVGGEVRQGPGGCTSENTCKSFCSDPNNFEVCKPFAPADAEFRGPGGCDNPQACRSHCETNPDSCRSYAPGSNGRYVPINCPQGQNFGSGGACTRVEKTDEAAQCAQGGKYWSGTGCQDNAPEGIAQNGGAFFQARPEMGNCKTPGDCYDYCKANAGTCGGFTDTGQRPPDTYIPTLYYTPGITVKHEPVKEMGNCTTPGGCYDFCKENPAKCQGFDAKAPRPVDTFVPGIYYTPPVNFAYTTPPTTNFYVTPIYYTPSEGSSYTTPKYYTPGQYSTPSYYTPPTGSNYTTPNYYTPGSTYYTPSGGTAPPPYSTPQYYTPPIGSNYATPQYYTPAAYTTPNYYTPPAGSSYTSPSYSTPGQYYSPSSGSTTTSYSYPSPSYVTPSGSYVTPAEGYATPSYSYPTPDGSYATPSYPTPSYPTPSYPTPAEYTTPPAYNTPSYNTPTYNTPAEYPTPSVQGVSTELNLLQRILLRLFN